MPLYPTESAHFDAVGPKAGYPIKKANVINVAKVFLRDPASDNNASMKSFFGGKIINQLSIPPNTFPPGLTFAFNYFDGRLTVIVQSYEHILNLKESTTLENNLRQLLN